MKKPVITIALFLAAALVVGVLCRRDLTQRREIDAAIADLKSSDTVRVNTATRMLSQSENPYAARRLAETLASLDGSSPARGAMMEAIQKSGERGLSAIIDVLTADPQTLPQETRLADERRSRLMSDVTTIVSAMRGEATGVLATLARHATAEARVAAARLLAETGDPSATPVLIDLLADDVEAVRMAAIKALGVLKPREAVEALAEVMQRDRNCAYEAARALGRSGHAEARDILLAALSHSDEAVRAAAVQGARGHSRDPRFIAPLINLARNEVPPVRFKAGTVLLFSKDPRVYDFMLELLDGDDSNMRRIAIGFLGRRGDQSVVEKIASMYEGAEELERESIAKALARLDPARGVPLLLEAVLKGDDHARRSAFLTLTTIDDPLVVEPIIEFLSSGDAVERRLAARALGRLGDERAVDALLKALEDEDPSVQAAALAPLFKFPQPRVVTRITELYGTFDRPARKTAVRGLLRMNTPEALAALEKLYGQRLAQAAGKYKVLIARGSKRDIELLITALRLHGTVEMAVDYMWSEEPHLVGEAGKWAGANDKLNEVTWTKDSPERPKWGMGEVADE